MQIEEFAPEDRARCTIVHYVTACGCSRAQTLASPPWDYPPTEMYVPLVAFSRPMWFDEKDAKPKVPAVREFKLKSVHDNHPAMPVEVWYREVLK